MRVEVFDVEHGQCTLLTTSQGGRILIDCGHNSSTGWRPSTHLRSLGVGYLEKLLVTNYDEDHVSDLAQLRAVVQIGILEKNPTVCSSDLLQLKSQHGAGGGIKALCQMMNDYNQPATPRAELEEVSITPFHNRYPLDFEDENNLSYVAIVKCHTLVMCFTGDMTRLGWLRLLANNPSLIRLLPTINVFFASHHGRADGRCQELYDLGLNPIITIISDSGVQHASQETVAWYRQRSRGLKYDGENRHVFTTRRDGKITIDARPEGAMLFTNWERAAA